MADTEEVERLRARVAELESAPPRGPASTATVHHRSGRSAASAVLVVLACLLAPFSVLSVWASTVVSDTDRYVETVAPVAEDPGVQAAIADEVTSAIVTNLELDARTSEALTALAAQPGLPPRVAAVLPTLAGPLSGGIESFTRDQVQQLLTTDTFQKIWDQANRVAHEQVLALLRGDSGRLVSAQGDQITLDLAPVIAEVRDRLVARGFGLAAQLPTINKTFVLAESQGIERAQRAYRLLDALGVWLPLITLASLAGGVLLARDRRRGLLRGSLGLAAAMVLLGLSLTLLRTAYVETTPGGVLTSESAGNVFELLVRFLRSALRAVAVLALLVALAAFVTGPSAAATRLRALSAQAVGATRGRADAAGWRMARTGQWVAQHRRALQVTTFFAGGLLLVFWPQPTVAVVLLVALLVLLGLAVIAFLGREPTAEPAPAGGPDDRRQQ